MDLVDIDKVLDELESLETQTSVPSDKSTQPSRQYTPINTSHRPIKVRSVLTSLNDYVDYDRKQIEKSSSSSAGIEFI